MPASLPRRLPCCACPPRCLRLPCAVRCFFLEVRAFLCGRWPRALAAPTLPSLQVSDRPLVLPAGRLRGVLPWRAPSRLGAHRWCASLTPPPSRSAAGPPRSPHTLARVLRVAPRLALRRACPWLRHHHSRRSCSVSALRLPSLRGGAVRVNGGHRHLARVVPAAAATLPALASPLLFLSPRRLAVPWLRCALRPHTFGSLSFAFLRLCVAGRWRLLPAFRPLASHLSSSSALWASHFVWGLACCCFLLSCRVTVAPAVSCAHSGSSASSASPLYSPGGSLLAELQQLLLLSLCIPGQCVGTKTNIGRLPQSLLSSSSSLGSRMFRNCVSALESLVER